MRDPARRLEKVVFEVGGKPYTWLDVLLAADARGEWPRFEAMVVAGLAADAVHPSEAEVDKALVAFRRHRDLTAAEDAERWLAHFDLGPAPWREAVRRSLLRARRNGAAVKASAAPSVFESSVRPEIWWPDAVVSGALEEWALRAAEDFALAGIGPSTVLLPADGPIEPLVSATWLASRPGAWARRVELAALTTRARAIEEAAVTPEALRSALAAHPIDWTWFTIELLSFRSEGAAREALLCQRLDEEPLADVARRSDASLHTLQCRMEELPEDLRVPCIGAREQQVIGPLARDGGFALLRIVERRPPSADDPAAVSHARDGIVNQIRARAARDRVRFLLPLAPR